MDVQEKGEAFLALLRSKLGNQIKSSVLNLGTPEVRIDRKDLLDFCKILRLDTQLGMDLFLSVTAVDWLDSAEERFEVVYHLLSVRHLTRLRIKAWVPESNPEIDSLVSIWPGANFMEREVWDMYGVRFKGHPDLRRILMYEEFQGHPLRKDYPVQGKQPRVPLLHPEVRNTAVDMVRPQLVKINSKRSSSKDHVGSEVAR